MDGIKVGDWVAERGGGKLRFKVRALSAEGRVWVELMRKRPHRWAGTGDWYKLDAEGRNQAYGFNLGKVAKP